jgi:hypothetical protein
VLVPRADQKRPRDVFLEAYMKKEKYIYDPFREGKALLDFIEGQFKEQLSLICTPINARILLRIIYSAGFFAGAHFKLELFHYIESLKKVNPPTCEAAYSLVADEIPRIIATSKLKKAELEALKLKTKKICEDWRGVKFWIDRIAPSDKYGRLYQRSLPYTYNRYSKRGKHVFCYPQEWFATEIGFTLRSLERCWSWLVKHGVYNKAWTENPMKFKDQIQIRTKNPRSAGWFICTGLKQIIYYLDPEDRHRTKDRAFEVIDQNNNRTKTKTKRVTDTLASIFAQIPTD